MILAADEVTMMRCLLRCAPLDDVHAVHVGQAQIQRSRRASRRPQHRRRRFALLVLVVLGSSQGGEIRCQWRCHLQSRFEVCSSVATSASGSVKLKIAPLGYCLTVMEPPWATARWSGHRDRPRPRPRRPSPQALIGCVKHRTAWPWPRPRCRAVSDAHLHALSRFRADTDMGAGAYLMALLTMLMTPARSGGRPFWP